jgi:ribonuclease M5
MIIVVEGKHDAAKIKSVFPEASVLITQGSAISQTFLEELISLNRQHTIVCCLDPDFAGEKIRKKIQEYIPDARHVFAVRERSYNKSRRKIGIEHLTTEDIRQLFDDIKIPTHHQLITMQMMVDAGLVGTDHAKSAREQLGERLGIGYANAKTMLARLNLFGISPEALKESL